MGNPMIRISLNKDLPMPTYEEFKATFDEHFNNELDLKFEYKKQTGLEWQASKKKEVVSEPIPKTGN